MKKDVIVISLGGSLIIPDSIDVSLLKKFKKVLLKNTKKHKFIVVCGGGSIARKYISALKEAGSSEHLEGLIGIASTRTNARFMNYFFNKDSEKGIPHSANDIKKILAKQDFIFCGALTYRTGATTDAQAADIAKSFNSIFINLTNVSGLFDKNPLEHKNAKFIPKISWKDFDKIASKMKFVPGQHFVLDQKASKMILKNKITTYILGKDMNQLDNLLNGRKFKGTIISG